jgi:hypothetical protein
MTKPSEKAPSVPKLTDLPDPKRLHDVTDRLNAELLDVQQALRDLKLGVSAYVTLDEDEHGWYKVLSFSKSGAEFKLVIQTGLEGDPDVQTTPLTSASRETRLEAAEALPKLYEKLLKAFEAEIERVNESITDVKQLAHAIRAKAGK